MTKLRSHFVKGFALAMLLLPALSVASEGGAKMESAQIDLADKASLQRGAGLYMSYCSGCHALSYQRYSRMGEDLGLTKEPVSYTHLRAHETPEHLVCRLL